MEVKIAKAVVGDISTLAQINYSAYMAETVAQFAFKHWPDENNSYDFYKARITDRFSDPSTEIFKATATDGKIVGFVCWTHEVPESGKPAKTIPDELKTPAPAATAMVTPTSKIIQQMPPFFDAEFVSSTAADVEQLRQLMHNGNHYYLSTFAVSRDLQRHGVGSQLLQHCLDLADQSSLRTWLIAFPGSHSLYLKFGFKDIDYRDVDLGVWDKGRMRGYGIYRQYAMLREASGN